MKHLAGGPLVNRVTLQSRDESSRDADGGINESWTTDETFWASVVPVTGRERLAADQLSAETTHRVERRYKAGITPKNRLQHDIRASLTDYASSVGTPWVRVASASAPFTADMVGQYLTITAGTNWTTGDYLIVEFVSSSVVVVNKAVASQNVSGGTGYVNRQLEIINVVDVDEAHVTTVMDCVEKTA
jgi:SPP1 family predicted phage head-tail adaptor